MAYFLSPCKAAMSREQQQHPDLYQAASDHSSTQIPDVDAVYGHP